MIEPGASDTRKCAGRVIWLAHCCNDYWYGEDHRNDFLEYACAACKSRRVSWLGATTKKKYEKYVSAVAAAEAASAAAAKAPASSANAAAAEELACLKKEAMEKQAALEEELEKLKIQLLQIQQAERNIVGIDHPTIFEAVKNNLVHKSSQSARILGNLKLLKSSKFSDAAHGITRLLKVPEDWVPEKECKVPELS